MQERIGHWLAAGVWMLGACGGVEDLASLQASRAALSCQADTDCATGYACAHFAQRSYCEPMATPASTVTFVSPADAGQSCKTDADCAAGEECESEHGSAYYCAPRREERKERDGADAGAAPEPCRPGEDDRYAASRCTDAGASAHRDDGADDGAHHGGEYGSEYEAESHDDEHDDSASNHEDRSGPNRGPH